VIALDATYSIGETLSGVGLYSHEILYGLAAAYPETGFEFCYRAHRYLRGRRLALPANARARLILEPFAPRGADLFHGLNQRLPRLPLRRAVATFHDLFVMTGEYSTPERASPGRRAMQRRAPTPSSRSRRSRRARLYRCLTSIRRAFK
jgi:hypothetical protein